MKENFIWEKNKEKADIYHKAQIWFTKEYGLMIYQFMVQRHGMILCSMWGNIKMVKRMVKEKLHGRIDIMRVSLRMMSLRAMVFISLKMAEYIKDIGRKIKCQVLVSWNGLMVIIMKDNLKMTKNMVMDSSVLEELNLLFTADLDLYLIIDF